MEEYFRASVFAMFERDGNGCISANHFLTYLSQRIQMQHNVGSPSACVAHRQGHRVRPLGLRGCHAGCTAWHGPASTRVSIEVTP